MPQENVAAASLRFSGYNSGKNLTIVHRSARSLIFPGESDYSEVFVSEVQMGDFKSHQACLLPYTLSCRQLMPVKQSSKLFLKGDSICFGILIHF